MTKMMSLLTLLDHAGPALICDLALDITGDDGAVAITRVRQIIQKLQAKGWAIKHDGRGRSANPVERARNEWPRVPDTNAIETTRAIARRHKIDPPQPGVAGPRRGGDIEVMPPRAKPAHFFKRHQTLDRLW